MYRILSLALLAALSLAVGVTADEKKEEKKGEKKEAKKEKAKASVVKFELLKSGHMAVEVKVNGKGPYTLIFDTGAPVSLVSMKLGKEAGLIDGTEKKDPLEAMLEKLIGISSAGEKKVKTLQVGDAKVNDVTVAVMDHPTVAALSKALDKPIHGLVGFPFFAQFEMTLDYQKKTMTLTPNGYKPPEGGMADMMKMLMEQPKARTLAPSAQWGLVCAKGKGDEEDGIDVKLVVPGGAAEKGGLKKGDRLLTLDSRWTDSVEDLYEAASHVKAGRKVKVKVKREGKEVVLEVTPARGL